ncbi:MAG: CAP domain-containing protein [Candidatus Heimdallarchaeota archaeon]|nr:CAP domain-containing protein [Candidatus Heimdallarchaeota archaeon]
MKISLFVIVLIITSFIPSSGDTITSLELEIHSLVNQEREHNDLNVLQLHSSLILIARAHSNDMLSNGYFSHTNLDGKTVVERVSEVGIKYTLVAENLFYASGYSEDDIAEVAVKGWIDSPGHYQNMLSASSYTGIGVANSGSLYYITQVFIEATAEEMDNYGSTINSSSESSFTLTQTHWILIFFGFLAFLKILDSRIRK